MSARLVISQRAEEDLTRQYRWYWDHAGMEVAERFLAAFDASTANVTEFPATGRACRYRAPELTGMRWRAVSTPFARHLVFYTTSNDEVRIERVIHGARDLPRRLLESPSA
jgi:plasmid stabilization system protein ParE